jgi:hypothetical protein
MKAAVLSSGDRSNLNKITDREIISTSWKIIVILLLECTHTRNFPCSGEYEQFTFQTKQYSTKRLGTSTQRYFQTENTLASWSFRI